MLFLLNDEVLDIGDPEDTLIDTLGVSGVRHERPSGRDVVEMAQQVHFRTPRGRDPIRNVRFAIASLASLKLDAAILVSPAGAGPAPDVQKRFSSVPLTMLAHKYAIQEADGAAPSRMHEAIWRRVA